MSASSRIAILSLALAALGAAAGVAIARPPVPGRLHGYGRALTFLGRLAHFVSGPPLAAAAALGFTPDGVTVLGTVLSVAAGLLAGAGEWGWAGVLLVFASWCDLLDGELARRTGAGSAAGAFLDSNLDRFSELALFLGLAAALPDRAGVLWAVAALGASLLVSYARARGEGLGVSCPAFGLERPHRLLAILGALLVAPFLPAGAALTVLEGTCAFIAVGAGATALARVMVIHRILRRAEDRSESRSEDDARGRARARADDGPAPVAHGAAGPAPRPGGPAA